jgi:3D (Asp-Asp-Asp) domain-containing protein
LKKLLITFSTAAALLFGSSSGVFAASNTYTVKSGDSLSRIAKTYHITVNDLKQWNNLKSDIIHPNQALTISKPAVAAVAKNSTVVKEFTVNASAYTMNCTKCSGITATGINLKKNPNQKVISVDPKVIPLGTKVYVEGYGYAIAADTGGAMRGNKIDVFFPTQKQALNWGRKTVKIQILK